MNTQPRPRISTRIQVVAVFLVSALVVAYVISTASTASATVPTQHALIIGIGEYPNLDNKNLNGPQNDVVLVTKTLTDWGFENENITILSDAVEGAELPTHAAIMGALETLVSESTEPGDFVYLHFAGHGLRQPAATGEGASFEGSDGLDETVLARDVGVWPDEPLVIQNAIVDNDIAHYVTRLRNNGVFVWAVFDSCHSAGMTRSVATDDERDRSVRFEDIVAPENREAAIQASMEAARSAPRSRGNDEPSAFLEESDIEASADAAGYVAFFAAQSRETTPEMRLPAGDPNRQTYGLFTYTLMNVVRTNPNITYRQLGDQILRDYQYVHRRRSPTPHFIGTALDAPVFGSSDLNRVEQYAVSIDDGSVMVNAGSLHDVSNSSILAIVPQPSSADSEVLGYLEVTSAQLAESVVIPVAYADVEAIAVDDIPDSAYARPVQKAQNLDFRVAMPEESGDARAVLEWVRELHENQAAEEDKRPNQKQWQRPYVFVPAGDAADLRLTVRDDRVWLMPPSGVLCMSEPSPREPANEGCDGADDVTPSVMLNRDGWGERFDEDLIKIAKATNLLRLVRTSTGRESPDVTLTLEYRRASTGAGDNYRDASCADIDGNAATQRFESATAASSPDLRPGDYVRFRVENHSRRDQDVNILHMDGLWGITSYMPGPISDEVLMAPGECVVFGGADGYLVNDENVGTERLLLISLPSNPRTNSADFRFLEQTAVLRTRSIGDPNPHGIRDMLEQAGFSGGNTRGFSTGAQEDIAMQVTTWRTSN